MSNHRCVNRHCPVKSILIRMFLVCASLRLMESLAAQSPMPLEIRERLWESPGPAQDAPDAPRLLIVYPREQGEVADGEAMRYAGRLDPVDATVTLNGEPLCVWPGGVFTGARSVAEGRTEAWRFVATFEGKTTTVEREVRREARPLPPARRPLAFAASPVSPLGEFLLAADAALPVRLWASPGAIAEARIGPNGAWTKMREGRVDPKRGASYEATLAPPDGSVRYALPVEFRLDAPDETQAIELRSRLRIGRMPETPLLGRIDRDFGTFLKAPDGWDRWGNWVLDTPFPVLEVRDDRMRVDFGAAEHGWVETSAAKIDWSRPFGARPRLDAPQVDPDRSRLILRWPDRKSPVGAVFEHELRPEGDRLTIRLPGAAALPDKTFGLHAARPIAALIASDATAGGSPRIEVTMKPGEVIWGCAMRGDPMSIEVRAKPKLPLATLDKPLAGLRVMLDAGHGGPNPGAFGALGPSGVVEADLNLVQAAWVERELAAMGAEIRQVRRGDEAVDLDERVAIAAAWDPDLFVSLHHNSVSLDGDPMADRGPKVFYHYVASEPLARAIAEKLAAVWPDATPRTLAQNFRVNRNISLCPSVLVETAFVCNPEDEARLRKTATLKQTARAIAEGVRDEMRQ
jgi:N-acetylmuramoyl-L-alanine amidase